MADINSRLKRALDGPGPQHKVAGQETFEFSEGTDGALHVKVVNTPGGSQEVTGSVEIANLPAVQDVADAGVTAELAAIKDAQAEIIAALATTNAKLDGTINTKVTGSYAEYRILSTDPEPEAKVSEKGAQLIVMDTGDIKMNHGGTWGEF